MILSRRCALGAATLTLTLLGAPPTLAQQPPPAPAPDPASPPAAAQPAAPTADPQSIATAQALYDQATAEMDAGNHASACPKLEEVTRLIPDALGAKLTLAACFEGAGRLASAWSQYVLMEALATRAGQTDRAQRAAEKAAALRPRLSLMTVTVPPSVRGIPGLTITRDGLALGEGQWGVAVPVDAGRHEVVVSAPGHSPWRGLVDVKADGEQVALEVQAPVAEAPKAAVPVVGGGMSGGEPTAGAGAVTGADAGSGAPRTWQRPVGMAAMGVGLLGIGVGAVLGGMALGKFGESNDGHCDDQDRCDATGLDLRDQAVGLGNGSTVAFVVGGVLAAGGVVLWVTAPSGKMDNVGEQARVGRAPRVGVTPGGLVIQGSW